MSPDQLLNEHKGAKAFYNSRYNSTNSTKSHITITSCGELGLQTSRETVSVRGPCQGRSRAAKGNTHPQWGPVLVHTAVAQAVNVSCEEPCSLPALILPQHGAKPLFPHLTCSSPTAAAATSPKGSGPLTVASANAGSYGCGEPPRCGQKATAENGHPEGHCGHSNVQERQSRHPARGFSLVQAESTKNRLAFFNQLKDGISRSHSARLNSSFSLEI